QVRCFVVIEQPETEQRTVVLPRAVGELGIERMSGLIGEIAGGMLALPQPGSDSLQRRDDVANLTCNDDFSRFGIKPRSGSSFPCIVEQQPHGLPLPCLTLLRKASGLHDRRV